MRLKSLSLAVLLGLMVAACGSGSSSDSSSSSAKLTVLAAASLKNVFPQIGDLFTQSHPGVSLNYSFGGTDQLAAQIEQGAPADTFAGASTKYGDQLADERLIEPYSIFCTNQLVLITPASNPAGITSPEDLATKHVKLVIGSETVPVGTYTRSVLSNLDDVYGPGYSDEVLANVVSNEDSATTILTKVQTGEADAGFVYVTDSISAGPNVKTITLPADANAVARYPIAVVSASGNLTESQQFMDFVLSPPAQELLKQAGFGSPPGS